jgi:hypothetical protein
VDWIHLTQDSDQRMALGKKKLKLLFHKILGISFSGSATIGVSKRTQLMELGSKWVKRPWFYDSLWCGPPQTRRVPGAGQNPQSAPRTLICLLIFERRDTRTDKWLAPVVAFPAVGRWSRTGRYVCTWRDTNLTVNGCNVALDLEDRSFMWGLRLWLQWLGGGGTR